MFHIQIDFLIIAILLISFTVAQDEEYYPIPQNEGWEPICAMQTVKGPTFAAGSVYRNCTRNCGPSAVIILLFSLKNN